MFCTRDMLKRSLGCSVEGTRRHTQLLGWNVDFQSDSVRTLACVGKRLVNGLRVRAVATCLGGVIWAGFASSLCAQTDIAQTDIAKTRSQAPVASQSGQSVVSKVPPSITPVATLAPVETVALSTQIRREGSNTLFELTTSRPVLPQIFVLSHPDRVVVDMSELEFNLPVTAGQTGFGLVTGFRYGIVAAGRARIVIDTTQPVRVVQSGAKPIGQGQLSRFAIALEAATVVSAPAELPQHAVPPTTPQPLAERKAGSTFVVMIDPGHGGIDGGAISATHVVEKDLTLAVARQLKGALEARPGLSVRLTRSTDTFVSLDARVELAQAAAADLFISIHADSVGDAALARTTRGATIYTLSETASNHAAQQFADKENAADLAGGLGATDANEASQVNSILTDLVKRETQNFSLQFKSLLIDRLRPSNMLGRDPSRAAAFKVLRQLQTPTVLIELGFLTHEMDAQQMQTADWQKRIAATIASAVDSYAARHAHAAR